MQRENELFSFAQKWQKGFSLPVIDRGSKSTGQLSERKIALIARREIKSFFGREKLGFPRNSYWPLIVLQCDLRWPHPIKITNELPVGRQCKRRRFEGLKSIQKHLRMWFGDYRIEWMSPGWATITISIKKFSKIELMLYSKRLSFQILEFHCIREAVGIIQFQGFVEVFSSDPCH